MAKVSNKSEASGSPRKGTRAWAEALTKESMAEARKWLERVTGEKVTGGNLAQVRAWCVEQVEQLALARAARRHQEVEDEGAPEQPEETPELFVIPEVPPSAEEADKPPAKFCPKCGQTFGKAEVEFCSRCGDRVKVPAPPEDEEGVRLVCKYYCPVHPSQQAEAQTFCEKCGRVMDLVPPPTMEERLRAAEDKVTALCNLVARLESKLEAAQSLIDQKGDTSRIDALSQRFEGLVTTEALDELRLVMARKANIADVLTPENINETVASAVSETMDVHLREKHTSWFRK